MSLRNRLRRKDKEEPVRMAAQVVHQAQASEATILSAL